MGGLDCQTQQQQQNSKKKKLTQTPNDFVSFSNQFHELSIQNGEKIEAKELHFEPNEIKWLWKAKKKTRNY